MCLGFGSAKLELLYQNIRSEKPSMKNNHPEACQKDNDNDSVVFVSFFFHSTLFSFQLELKLCHSPVRYISYTITFKFEYKKWLNEPLAVLIV